MKCEKYYIRKQNSRIIKLFLTMCLSMMWWWYDLCTLNDQKRFHLKKIHTFTLTITFFIIKYHFFSTQKYRHQIFIIGMNAHNNKNSYYFLLFFTSCILHCCTCWWEIYSFASKSMKLHFLSNQELQILLISYWKSKYPHKSSQNFWFYINLKLFFWVLKKTYLES